MAQTLVTFVVDDTSPTIHYSPFADTFGAPDLTAGWNPYFTSSGFATAQGTVGQGTSQHITSLDGASLAFQWRGSGIKLLGNATHATYNISIDGQTVPLDTALPAQNVLLNVSGLPEGLHNITLTASITPAPVLAPNTSSIVVFDQAVVLSAPINPTNGFWQNSTLSDNDIAFSGLWSVEGTSFHTSTRLGDKASTIFNGSTLLILGRTSPSASNYTVILDGSNSTMAVNQTFSAKSSFTQDSSLLFFASDLDQSVMHSVQVINEDNAELALAVGGFRAFMLSATPPPPLPSASQPSPAADLSSKRAFEKGTIAAFALAGILAFVLITGGLFFLLVYRPRRRRRQQARASRNSAKPPGTNGEGVYSEKGFQGDQPSPVINIAPMYDVKEEPDLEADSAEHDPAAPELAGAAAATTANNNNNNNRFSAISEGFQRWTRAAVRGSLGGVALGGLRFRHSDSPPSAHVRQDTTPGDSDGSPQGSGRNRPMSEISSWTETSSAARRRHEKRMGKMRAVVSWLPSPTYSGGGGGSSAGHGNRNSRRESRRQSRRASYVPTSAPIAELAGAAVAGAAVDRALNGSERRRTLPVPMPTRRPPEGTAEGHEPPSYAASIANSHSTPSTRDSNPGRSVDPSLIIPPSVSPGPADTSNDRDTAAEVTSNSDMASFGQTPRASVVRPRENLAAVLAGPRPSAPPRINTAADRKNMRDVLRSLSPRTSSARRLPVPPPAAEPEPEFSSRWIPSLTQPLPMSALAEEQSPESASSPSRKPLLAGIATAAVAQSEGARGIKKLPQTPTSPLSSSSSIPSPVAGDNDAAAASFLSLPQNSPFRVDFPASRNPSLRPLPSPHTSPERNVAALSAAGSSNPDIYFTPSIASSGAQNSSAQAVEDAQEGSSRRPFRFTAITLPTSSAVPTIYSPQDAPGHDDESPESNGSSFLDFTSSREPSLQQPPQSNRPSSRSLPVPPLPPVPPVIVEPKSRWSNTTAPTMTTTSYGGGARSSYHGNLSSGESQYLGVPTGDDEFRHFSTSSTFPIPVSISIPPSPHHIMEHTPSPADSNQSNDPPQMQSMRVSHATQGSGDLHVHPTIPMDQVDSPVENVSDSDIQFRHSFATDVIAPSSTSSGEETGSRPYDPSILVSRVLGIPSPTSSMTARAPGPHTRTLSGSTPSPSIPRSILTSKSDTNSSNDRLNPGSSS